MRVCKQRDFFPFSGGDYNEKILEKKNKEDTSIDNKRGKERKEKKAGRQYGTGWFKRRRRKLKKKKRKKRKSKEETRGERVEGENPPKKNSLSFLSSLSFSAAERAPVGKVLRPVPARELVQPRDVGHRVGPEAEPPGRGQDQPVARAAPRDKGRGLVAARPRDGRAVAVAGEVGGERVAVGAVVGGGEAVDGALDVVDEGGAVALADLHREADAVRGGACFGFRVFFVFFGGGRESERERLSAKKKERESKKKREKKKRKLTLELAVGEGGPGDEREEREEQGGDGEAGHVFRVWERKVERLFFVEVEGEGGGVVRERERRRDGVFSCSEEKKEQIPFVLCFCNQALSSILPL